MKSRMKYLIAFAIVLLIEIVIALFVNDSFVRPYIGDVLVIVLMYFGVRIFIPQKGKWLPCILFVFAAGIEILQYLNIVEWLGLSQSRMARVIIGTTFDYKDIFCYGVGSGILQIWELCFKGRWRKKNEKED